MFSYSFVLCTLMHILRLKQFFFSTLKLSCCRQKSDSHTSIEQSFAISQLFVLWIQIFFRKLQHIYLVRRMFVVLLESTLDNLRTNKRSLRQVFEPNNFHGGKMARSCWLVLFDKMTSLVVVVNQSWMMYLLTTKMLQMLTLINWCHKKSRWFSNYTEN